MCTIQQTLIACVSVYVTDHTIKYFILSLSSCCSKRPTYMAACIKCAFAMKAEGQASSWKMPEIYFFSYYATHPCCN
jgi:hypothetical protein